jgi:hypothetical protein
MWRRMMNNPQKTRTPESIAQSAANFLHSDKGNERVCIFVEGSDDAKIYPQFFKDIKTRAMVIKSTGKQKMEEALRILPNKTNKAKQAIGICDADFYHLDEDYPIIANIFFTDYHDIEMTMLYFTDVFRNTWSKFSLRDNTKEIMPDILQNAVYIAYIRWYNHKNQCNLFFRDINYTNFFKVQEGKITQDTRKLLDTLNQRSNNKTRLLVNEEIDIFIQEKQTDDLYNLCNGHDVTTLIALILEYKTGNSISQEDYCSVLRESFQLNHFIQTRLYDNILSWQKTNGFDILEAEPGAVNA